MTIDKNLYSDIQDAATKGDAAAALINENKRAVNQIIDKINLLPDTLGTAAGYDVGAAPSEIPRNSDLGSAATKSVATDPEIIAGTSDVLPTAEQVRKNHVATANTLSDLLSLEPAFDRQQCVVASRSDFIAPVVPRGGGVFVARYGDYSAKVTVDTCRGVYVPFPSDPTGATGAWVRSFNESRVNAAWFGATGDGSDQTIELDCAESVLLISAGEGTLYLPTGQYLRTTPWELPQGVSLQGEGQDQSVIIKTNGSLDSRGRDSVIAVYDKNRFRIKDIGTQGNKNIGVPGTSLGMMLQGCSYFRIDNVRNWLHKHGIYLKTCWLCNIDSPVSQQCEEYGYRFDTACTSITLTGPTSWGCGGHVVMVGCLYSVINSGACDQSDAGGFPADPFLPVGSGGDYQNPSYIFSITSSQGITINSPGTESGYSKYLYMEGSQVVLNTPYCFSLEGYAANWNFIELRGSGTSDLTINNPWFTGIQNTLAPAPTRRGIYVENPNVQTVRLNRFLKLSDTFGEYEFSARGIEYTYAKDAVRMDQSSMDIGGTNPLIPTSGGTISIVNSSGIKEAQFSNATDNTYFVVPLPEKGTIKVHTRGTFSSGFDVFRMKVREVGGADLKEWTNIDTDDYFTIDSVGTPVEFAIRKFKAADTLNMTELVVEHIV